MCFGNLGGIGKSKSTSNFLTLEKAQLMHMNEQRDKLVKEVSQIKASVKSRPEPAREEEARPKKPAAVAKRAVKVLDKIDEKNDQISRLKLDNRIKHAAQTSTPSGLRRKPLKLPTEVSMIVTPQKQTCPGGE